MKIPIILDKCYFVIFMSNTNHYCGSSLANELEDQIKKKKCT